MIWDLWMVVLLFLNLFLIVFDLTYFFLRPTYFLYAPGLTKVYDKVKGIEAQPFTKQYMNLADDLVRVESLQTKSARKEAKKLVELSGKMVTENPFIQSGQGANLKKIVDIVTQYLIRQGVLSAGISYQPEDILRLFWTLDSEDIQSRLAVYQQKLRPLIAMNFERRRGLDGEYIDYFFWLDFPFLVVFFGEFMIRWFLAIRRKTYIRWFLFPLYNWYDILGMFPYGSFRVFRLFRIVSIYVRLHRSELTTIGDDYVSKTVKYYSNIISEEISDMVATRILTEIQEEIQSGASLNILLKALEPRREELKKIILSYLKELVGERETMTEFGQILYESLDRAAQRLPTLQLVPDKIKARFMTEIGMAIYTTLQETLTRSLEENGEKNPIGNLIDSILDDLMHETTDSGMVQISTAILINLIENMKKVVAVKKWADKEMK